MTLLVYTAFGIIFSLLICWCSILYTKQYRHNKSFSIYIFSVRASYLPLIALLFLSFIFFTAFRVIDYNGIGGMDAKGYMLRFENANLPFMQSLVEQSNEPLYGLFVWIIRSISPDFHLFLIFYYTVIFILQIKLLSRIKITGITVISYFALCFTLILLSFCLMRNILAVFLAVLAYFYLDEKKYAKSFLWITIATLIHFVSIICYPAWLIYILSEKKDFSLKKALWYWGILFVMVISLSSFAPFVLTFVDIKYVVYLKEKETDIIIALPTFIGRSYIILLSIWKFKALVRHNSINKIMFVVVLVNLLILPIQIVVPMAYRMILLADLAVFFLIPELIRVYPLKRNNYHITLGIRLSLFLYLTWNIISFVRNSIPSYGLDNYSNIFFN